MTLFVPTIAHAVPNPDLVVPTANYEPYCNAFTSPSPIASVCKADNREVYYFMKGSGEFAVDSVDRTRIANSIWRYDPTDINIHYDSTPVWAGTGQTDVIFEVGSKGLDTGVVGFTWCNHLITTNNYQCDQTYVRIRPGWVEARVATHETGHALGLLHGWSSSPRLADCAAALGPMRGDLNCSGFVSADLTSQIITNLNYSY
ncbi:MAG: hypothetical protein QM606_08910 [Leucobacter sp.]